MSIFTDAARPAPDDLDRSYEALIEDWAALDRLTQAVMMNEDRDYLAALERIDDWFTLAGEHRDDTPTLRQALEHAQLDVGAYRKDLIALANRETDFDSMAEVERERRRRARRPR